MYSVFSSVSRILSVQLELQETRIRWTGEKEAAQVKIADLQKKLVMKEEAISELLKENKHLEKTLADRTEACEDLNTKYNGLTKQLNSTLGKLHDTSLKQVLEIVALNIEIDNIRSNIARETSPEELNKLKEQLKNKIIELNWIKDELRSSNQNADKILMIIEKTTEIQNLQSKVVQLDGLDQINGLQQQLIKLIDELNDSHPAKLVLKNMVMLSDVSWLKKLIGTITKRYEKQISDLEELLKKTEDTLEKKIAELVKKGSNVDQLTRDIVSLRTEVQKLKDEIRKVKDSSAAEVKVLENKLTKTKQELDKGIQSLNKKDAELAQKVTKITQLIEELRLTKQKAQEKDEETAAKITDLEDRVKKAEVERNTARAAHRKLQQELEEAKKCTETVNEIQNKFNKELSQLNNTFARQVLTIQTLSEEISALQHKLTKSEGNTDELQKDLKKKTEELKNMKKELGKARVDSDELLKLMESMRKVSKQQDQSIAEYLAEIDALDKEIQTLMTKVGSTGDEKAQLTIQVLVLKDEIAKLENLQAELKADALKKATGLEKEIEEMNKEIAFLKRSGCGSAENKDQIARLQEKVKAKEQELAQLNTSRKAELQLLEGKLAKKEQELESSAAELKKIDEHNADLILRLADLGQQLKKATSAQDSIRTKADQQIKELKSQLRNKEGEVSNLKKSKTDLEDRVKKAEVERNTARAAHRKLQQELEEAKKCTEVHKNFTEVQTQIKIELSQLNNSFARQVLTIQTLSEEISALQHKLTKSEGNTDELQKDLKKKIEELKNMKKELGKARVDSDELLKLMESMGKVSKQQDQSIAEYLAEIDALDKEIQTLMTKVGSTGDEKAQLTIQVLVLKDEIAKLENLQAELKADALKKATGLEKEIEEMNKEIAFLKRSGCGSAEIKDQIARLQEKVKAKEQELAQLNTSTEAELQLLEGKLAKKEQELESSESELTRQLGQNAALILRLADLGQQLKEATSAQDSIRTKADQQIKDLTSQLRKKEGEVSNLKKSKTDLEDRVKKAEVERNTARAAHRKLQQELEEAKKCTEVHKNFTEVQTQIKIELSQLNNSFARQVLTIQTLSEEISALQHKLTKSEGNTDELQKDLKKKTEELKNMKKELGKARVDSDELLKLMESMGKVSKQQDQSIAEYLAEIDALDKEIQTLMTKVGSTGDEKAQLTIQVLVLKDEIAKLENLQAELKADALKKATGLEKEIEEMNKEIAFLKRSGCGSAEIKDQIARLQKKVKAKEQELAQLNTSTEAELQLLEGKLAKKEKELESIAAELKKKDEHNADLILRLADLGQQLKEATSAQDSIRTKADQQIKDLKSQLKIKEDEVSDLKKSKADLQEEVKKKDKDDSQLKKNNADLKSQLKIKEDEVSDLKKSKADLQEELKKQDKDVSQLKNNNADLKSQLKIKEDEVSDLKKSKADLQEEVKKKDKDVSQLKNNNADLKSQLKIKEDEVSDLKKSKADLQEELKKKDNDVSQLKKNNAALQSENQKVKELLTECKSETHFTVVSPELDPNTAHRRLLLSGKGKVVKGSQFARLVSTNPERYDFALAAVAKTGYDSGKPYWEVDVDIRTCFVVGVAKESAQRKGNLVYGPKNGYWGILRRKDGQYQVFNDKPIPLNLSTPPTVIGVLLDFNKGNIVFYNAKTKTPIYTYQNNAFTEKLYPYIETCTDQDKSEPPIVISDVDSTLQHKKR
ncbi:uncharacterized protein [Salminus brasiliensis]|uniref:uncharacterized protein n=1 Tax=Salminus brasiliensis TaxID=930266 RepID=UPI003B832A8A